MSERSSGEDGRGTEPPQTRRNDRGFGKRRRRKRKRRQPSNGSDQTDLRQTAAGDDIFHPGARVEDSEPFGKSDIETGSCGPKSRDKNSQDAFVQNGHTQGQKARRNRYKKRGRGQNQTGSDVGDSRKDTGRHTSGAFHQNNRRSPVYAALDLGTNNCRLLVAVPRQKGRFRVIDGFSRIVRLGEGLSQTGRLSDAAMDRAVEALKVCATKLGNREVKNQRLIATEACRQAENGDVFLGRVKEETGLELEIVTRETEARLAAEGCGSLMDAKSDAAVMFDIGGGSTELILVRGSRRRRGNVADRIVDWTSLPLGVVTLAERFGGKDVTRELFSNMVRTVIDEISEFEGRKKLQSTFQSGYAHLLGTSGTVTTLAGIHLGLDRYDRRKVDGLWLRSEEIDDVIRDLLGMNYKERANNPCIGTERADLVLAGCAILEAIRKVWPTERLRVADRGLREGLLAEMMNADGVWNRSRRHRRHDSKSSGDGS
ncbi:MAG: Ppx/GppA phosphatase family protein [Pseudomonadota bacterium]